METSILEMVGTRCNQLIAFIFCLRYLQNDVDDVRPKFKTKSSFDKSLEITLGIAGVLATVPTRSQIFQTSIKWTLGFSFDAPLCYGVDMGIPAAHQLQQFVQRWTFAQPTGVHPKSFRRWIFTWQSNGFHNENWFHS